MQTPHDPQAILAAIKHRRSFALKDLTDLPVERAQIEQILEAGNWAPSHGKTEPWRFVVYSGAKRSILADAFGAAFRQMNPHLDAGGEGVKALAQRPWQAPVWIALGMQPSGRFPEWEDLIAFGSAVQNMHIMASALGLAAKWTSGAVVMHPHVAEVVGFAPDVKLYGFLYIGHPAGEWPAGVRGAMAEKVTWNE